MRCAVCPAAPSARWSLWDEAQRVAPAFAPAWLLFEARRWGAFPLGQSQYRADRSGSPTRRDSQPIGCQDLPGSFCPCSEMRLSNPGQLFNRGFHSAARPQPKGSEPRKAAEGGSAGKQETTGKQDSLTIYPQINCVENRAQKRRSWRIVVRMDRARGFSGIFPPSRVLTPDF